MSKRNNIAVTQTNALSFSKSVHVECGFMCRVNQVDVGHK